MSTAIMYSTHTSYSSLSTCFWMSTAICILLILYSVSTCLHMPIAICILLILQQFIHLPAHVNSYISYLLAYATKRFVARFCNNIP